MTRDGAGRELNCKESLPISSQQDEKLSLLRERMIWVYVIASLEVYHSVRILAAFCDYVETMAEKMLARE